MSELLPQAEARDMKLARGPRKSGPQLLWGEEGRRNERAFAAGGSEGYEACPDDMEGKELPGVACLLDK